MSLSYINALQNGVPGPGRSISVTTTSVPDNYEFNAKRMARLFATAANCHWAFVHNAIRDGLFSLATTWGDANDEPDLTEGNRLRRRGGVWLGLGPAEATDITLNATSPIASQTYDCKLAHDDQDTQLFQIGVTPYAASQKLDLRFNHMESAGVVTIDYAIVRHGSGEALNYLQGGGTFTTSANWFTVTNSETDAQVTKPFTADIAARYGVIFRPTSDQAASSSQIARVFFAPAAEDNSPELPAGIQEYSLTDGRGHFAFKADTGTVPLTIAEMQPGV